MVTPHKVWINKTTTTQTDILINLTVDEPWAEHVLERPRSPADNQVTIELVYTFWEKIFDILGTGVWKTRIPYKNRDSTFHPRFKKIVRLLFELSGRAQFKKITNLLIELAYKAQDMVKLEIIQLPD
jgi:hypothetical protein